MVNSINTGFNYQTSTTQSHINNEKRANTTTTTMATAPQPDYKKLGAIALGIAVLLTGIIKHKSIGNFIRNLGKGIETKSENGGAVIAEDYPEWKPHTKPKKQRNPLKTIIDENGNTIGFRNPLTDNNDKFSSFEEIV